MKYSVPVSDKEYSPEEVAAAIKIQAMWRGTYVRLLMKARTPGMIFLSVIKCPCVCKNEYLCVNEKHFGVLLLYDLAIFLKFYKY